MFTVCVHTQVAGAQTFAPPDPATNPDVEECPHPRRACNGPVPFGGLMASRGAATPPAYLPSDGFPAHLRAAVESGVGLVSRFLGPVSPVPIFLFELGRDAAAYDAAVAAAAGRGVDVRREAEDAAAGAGGIWASGRPVCACGHQAMEFVPLFFLVDATYTAASLESRAIHEYTHAVQMHRGHMWPTWFQVGFFRPTFFLEDRAVSSCRRAGPSSSSARSAPSSRRGARARTRADDGRDRRRPRGER